MSDPADPDRELYATGALLPGPNARLAGPTFAEWLDAAPDDDSAPGARPPRPASPSQVDFVHQR